MFQHRFLLSVSDMPSNQSSNIPVAIISRHLLPVGVGLVLLAIIARILVVLGLREGLASIALVVIVIRDEPVLDPIGRYVAWWPERGLPIEVALAILILTVLTLFG